MKRLSVTNALAYYRLSVGDKKSYNNGYRRLAVSSAATSPVENITGSSHVKVKTHFHLKVAFTRARFTLILFRNVDNNF